MPPDPLPPPTRRFTPPQLLAFDLLVVAALAVVGQAPYLAHTRYDMPYAHEVEITIWVLVSVCVLCRRRFPRQALVLVVVLGMVALWMRSHAPISQYVALVVYSVVTVSTRRAGMIAAGVTGVLVVGATYLGTMEPVPILSLGEGATIVIGWLAGEYVRVSRERAVEYAGIVAERAAAADADRRDQVVRAVAEERVKLARELHDVVAHAMSVIAVRAGVARVVIDSQPDQAREALGIIETTTRRTLQEMRLLVGVLRGSDTAPAELGPAPGLADLPRLISEVEVTGVAVDLDVRGRVRALNPAVDLSAYRIVQEALTNVVRHAGPTRANVVLSYGANQVGIDVHDTGRRTRPDPALVREGTGHGLIGIRERAALFGGHATAGPDGDGYRVRVVLRTNDLDHAVEDDAHQEEPAR